MVKNIFKIEKYPENQEIVEILKENNDVKIEKIISKGQTTDWMIQDKEEFVVLVQGKAVIEFEKNDKNEKKIIQKVELTAGDSIIIQKYEKHRVSYTSSDPCCIWICVFY